MIKDGQLAQIAKDFKTCQNLTIPNDLKTFAYYLQGGLMQNVQFNHVSGNSSTISGICMVFMEEDPYKALVKLNYVSRIVNFSAFLPYDIF